MRRFVLGLSCAVSLLVAGASQSAVTRPSLSVLTTKPISVRGTNFRPSEHVTVTVTLNASYRTKVTARRGGAFTASFAKLSAKCASFRVVAVGNRGSRASLVVPVECPLPPDPPLLPTDPIPGKTHH